MVERSQQQHHIRALVVLGELARITDAARRQPMRGPLVARPRDCHQTINAINEPDVVTELGEPERVGPGRSADVDYYCWRRGSVPQNQLTGTKFLEARGAILETRLFRLSIIVVRNGGIEAR